MEEGSGIPSAAPTATMVRLGWKVASAEKSSVA
jgi:hypothetical protein